MKGTDILKKKIIDARTILSNYYMSLNYHTRAKDAVAPIVDLTLELNYLKGGHYYTPSIIYFT
jgi:predicted RNA-binding protein associated with RNAse of E/G family